MKKVLLVFMIVCLSTVAFAQGSVEKQRVGFFTGYFIPAGEVKDGLNMGFNSSMNYGIEYSYAISRILSLGVFLERRAFETDRNDFYLTGSSDTFDVRFKGTSTILGISGTVTHDIETIQLFASGKLGYAMNKIKYDLNTNFAGSFSDDSDKITFAVIMEAGARHRFDNNIDVGLFAKYTYNKQDFGNNVLEDSVDLGGFAMMAGVGYSF